MDNRIKDRTGIRYGRLVVLGFAGMNDVSRRSLWLCRCDCGTERVFSSHNLGKGTSSCGCLRRATGFPRIDMTGRTYGRLTVVEVSGRIGSRSREHYWRCTCECGQEATVLGTHLRSGQISSCGCLRAELAPTHSRRTHEMSKTREYRSWQAMKARCTQVKNTAYKHYGGRGITYCPEWESFEQFYADMGPRPTGMTLDRIDNDGNYEPGNCRWATVTEQNNNRGRRSRLDVAS